MSHRGCHHGDLASQCCGWRPGLQTKTSEPVAGAAAKLAHTSTTSSEVSLGSASQPVRVCVGPLVFMTYPPTQTLSVQQTVF